MTDLCDTIRRSIENCEDVLGIELGSTQIKAVLIGPDHEPIASGSYDWENSYRDNIWTYPLEEVLLGLKGCYSQLKANVRSVTASRSARCFQSASAA